MLYPSIQELLKATSKENGEEKLNKYSLVMATAKCARIITNQYIQERREAEKKVANKETDKDVSSLINKDYRDEKAVKNALREMKDGEFEVYLPGEQGYEDSIVVVEDYKEPEREIARYIPVADEKKEENAEEAESEKDYDDFDDDDDENNTSDLMGATNVFDTDSGYTIEDAEE